MRKSRKGFTVEYPKITVFCALGLAVMLFALTLPMLITMKPEKGTEIFVRVSLSCLFGSILVALLLWALWLKTFKITVKGIQISVRKRFGLKRFTFDVSEITNVRDRIIHTRTFINCLMTVRAGRGRKFRIEMLMPNADKFMNFIEANVDENKITKVWQEVK